MKKKILLLLIVVVAALLYWQVFWCNLKFYGKATLTWNASSDKNVTDYKIYYGTSKRMGDCPQGGYDKKLNVGNKISYQVNNLNDGETYYFSVTSINNQGKESCFSEEMNKEIKLTFLDKIKSLLDLE